MFKEVTLDGEKTKITKVLLTGDRTGATIEVARTLREEAAFYIAADLMSYGICEGVVTIIID